MTHTKNEAIAFFNDLDNHKQELKRMNEELSRLNVLKEQARKLEGVIYDVQDAELYEEGLVRIDTVLNSVSSPHEERFADCWENAREPGKWRVSLHHQHSRYNTGTIFDFDSKEAAIEAAKRWVVLAAIPKRFDCIKEAESFLEANPGLWDVSRNR